MLALLCLLLPVFSADAVSTNDGTWRRLNSSCVHQCSHQIRSIGCDCQDARNSHHIGVDVNFVCREADMIALSVNMNATTVNCTYFYEYLQRNHTNWTFSHGFQSNTSNIIVTHLEEDTEYIFRVWIVSNSGRISPPINSTWIRTKRFVDAPLPVTNMTLLRYEYIRHDYRAVISWSPSRDNSCHHDFVWYGAMDTSDYTNLEVDIPFGHTITISKLLFNSSYMVLVRTKSTDWKRESAKVSLRLTTPTCFQVLKSLLHCVPETPSGLHAREERIPSSSIEDAQFYNVYVRWNRPSALPRYYIVHLNTFSDDEARMLNTSGNATVAIFSHTPLGLHYEVTLFAFSPAGKSNPAEFYKQIKPTHLISSLSHSQEDDASGNNNNRLLHFTLAGFLVVFCAAPILSCAYRKLRNRKATTRKEPEEYELKSFDDQEGDNLSDKYDSWEIDENCLSLHDVLGRGAFGVVYNGCLQRGDARNIVAVKMLLDHHTASDIQDFKQEIEIMKSVGSHPHIVSLIGCYTKGAASELKLIVEFCARGDLLSFLRDAWEQLTNQCTNFQYLYCDTVDTNTVDNRLYLSGRIDERSLQMKDLISIGLQVASGMEYLSSLHVLHRDLAARNILVCEDGSVKVSDFGLSRDVYRENVYCKTSSGKVPIRWLALESLTHQVYTTQTDVWSYGVLLWEVVTLGASPYPGVQTHELLDLLIKGYRMRCPSNCSQELYAIMRSCWEVIPNERPSFGEIRHLLDHLLESSSEYLNLNLCHYLKYTDDDGTKLSSQSMSFLSERYVKTFD